MDEPKPPAAALVEIPGCRRSASGEVALFCDRCGYALNGLPMLKCRHCDVLQFTCPECGHHQSINSQALAMQRISRGLRLAVMVAMILVRLNLFGWSALAFFIGGYEESPSRQHYGYPRDTLFGMSSDAAVGFLLFGVAFGLAARLLLLRWKSALFVSLALGAAVALAALGGGFLREWERAGPQDVLSSALPVFMGWCGTWVAFGAMVAWPVWVAIVKLFLPDKAAKALLEWQRSLSEKHIQPA